MNQSQAFYRQEPSTGNNGWSPASWEQNVPAQGFGKMQLPPEVWWEQQPLGTIGEIPFIPDFGSAQGQLAMAQRVKHQLTGQKAVCEKVLNKVNKAIEDLDERIKTLENSEEIVVSVVTDKLKEALANGSATEEMIAAFQTLKKSVIP